tara:strand:+ start:433 stop:600 length:168 start_codon:yes stop_codon:yes gene_type:complete
MNIQSAKYIVLGDGHKSIQATIDEVEMNVPLDPNNRHYAAIQEWVDDGNTIQEAD